MTGLRRADLWFGLLLALFGGAVVVESWQMPRLQDLGVHPMSAPGLTPGLLGVVLAGLGLALLVRSLAVGGPVAATAERGWGRLAATLTLCLVYAAGLVGRLPFWLATFLFVSGFVALFSWPGRSPVRVGLVALILGAGVAVSVTLLFERVFLVRLP